MLSAMENRDKKIAAAIAAVGLYLEDEARLEAEVVREETMRRERNAMMNQSGAWSQYGREQVMRMRGMVTMRLWK